MNNVLSIVFITAIVMVAIFLFVIKFRSSKSTQTKDKLIEAFTECLPTIDRSIDALIQVYAVSKNEEETITYVVDYIYNSLNTDTDVIQKYGTIITKENIKKYLYPLFKSMYEKKIDKKIASIISNSINND